MQKDYTKVAIPGLLPYLDDYIMGDHDPFVEDFHWSMDDNRHTESKSPELTEGDVPKLLLFADRDVIRRVRTQAASSAEPAARRDVRGSRAFAQAEIKRHRQGLKVDELSSTDVIDVTVFNLGNLARQSIQRQADPRMLRLIMNQTSHIMMLVEGISLSVNQWDCKLRDANWTLSLSDDRHHWLGVRTASSGTSTSITPLVDNCGSAHQKIWYAVFDVKLGNTSDGKPVWKGGQNVYRVMVVHIHHSVARTACRSCRINFADLLVLCAHFQVDLVGVLAVRPFFLAFVGVPFWAPGVLAIFGFSRYLGGLRFLAPLLRPFSRTRGGKGASLLRVLVLFFTFLVCFAAAHLLWKPE